MRNGSGAAFTPPPGLEVPYIYIPACFDVIYPQRVSSRGHRAKLIDLLKRTRNDDCHARVVKHLMEQGGVKIVTHRTGRTRRS